MKWACICAGRIYEGCNYPTDVFSDATMLREVPRPEEEVRLKSWLHDVVIRATLVQTSKTGLQGWTYLNVPNQLMF